MKKLAIWTASILALLGVVAVIVYQVVLPGDPTTPEGMFSSYEFFGHAENDVLIFENGSVTLSTCCSDDDYGTYAKSEEGTWIWTYQLTMTTMSNPTPHGGPENRVKIRSSSWTKDAPTAGGAGPVS